MTTPPTPAPAPTSFPATPGAKMIYLIKRRSRTSREELIAHWFGSHMPAVIEWQRDAATRGKTHARRYFAILFDPDREGRQVWDGMAQLWYDRALRRTTTLIGTEPTDTFQQHVEPYLPWATTEYVILDGSEHLEVRPLTLNAPFPCTRSGFFKLSFLVKAKSDTDFDAFFAHWLGVHVPNVKATMERAGGFRYVVSHSLDPSAEPYAGLAELYFHDASGWARYRELIQPDGMERWVDADGTPMLRAGTELIGIP